MPYGVLFVAADIATTGMYLATQLPEIVAPALSIENRNLHEGKVTPKEIMILPILGHQGINGKDIELVIFAHDFPERVANVEERKDLILKGVHNTLYKNVADVSVAVCLMLVPMAYGESFVRDSGSL